MQTDSYLSMIELNLLIEMKNKFIINYNNCDDKKECAEWQNLIDQITIVIENS